jgi:hypothetical protein
MSEASAEPGNVTGPALAPCWTLTLYLSRLLVTAHQALISTDDAGLCGQIGDKGPGHHLLLHSPSPSNPRRGGRIMNRPGILLAEDHADDELPTRRALRKIQPDPESTHS